MINRKYQTMSRMKKPNYPGQKTKNLKSTLQVSPQVVQVMKAKVMMKNLLLLVDQEDIERVDEAILRLDLQNQIVKLNKSKYQNHFGRYGQNLRRKFTLTLSKSLGKILQKFTENCQIKQ